MYEAYWELERKPFGSGCETALYYPGDAHQATLLKLRYAVESRHGAALVTGHSGVGKTLVTRLLAERLPQDCGPWVHLTYPQMPTANLLAYLAHELQTPGLSVGRESSIDESVRLIGEQLRENAKSGRHATIVVDEAHLLDGTRTFEALRLLLNFEHEGRPTVTIVFVGQPALMPLLERMPQLEQRLVVKCLLRPLSVDETHSYVQHRLQSAGAKRPIFESEALDALRAVSQGIPRDINRLCDLALLISFADGEHSITADRIEAVAAELVNVADD